MEGEKGPVSLMYSMLRRAVTTLLVWEIALLGLPAQAQSVQVRQPLTTTNVRTEESNLANVVTDAIRMVASAEIGLMAASSFAEITINEGEARVEDFERALVFRGDTVVVMNLTGAQIRKALEHGLSLYPARSAAFLQVSGISFQINAAAPRGERVENVRVGNNPLDPDRVYKVAMPAPLAGGALVYSKAWSRENQDRDTKITLAEALRFYLARNSEISGKTGERIVVRR